ncbi:MAG: nuclease A inhibitor family protein [Cyanobacteriota bacterium]|nr:nuclease A inhibitor family protein [Cyanobacteriota bacterium]
MILLGTLEILVRRPFFWDTEKWGIFNIWNLMRSEGCVNLTDVEVAIAHWQNVEHWGTPTNQIGDSWEYAPFRDEDDDERDDDWNAEIEAFRVERYQQLLTLLKAELLDLQAFRLTTVEHLQRRYPDFCFYILIGKTEDGDWFCFSPIVPDQVSDPDHHSDRFAENEDWFYFLPTKPNQEDDRSLVPLKTGSTETNSLNSKALDLQSKIDAILSELPPITIYGYYDGGYDYTYEHQIVYAIADSKILAVEKALQAAEMLKIENRYIEFRSNEYNRKLSQFFHTQLHQPKTYSFSFWDIGYIYQVAETPTGDWLGVRKMVEFDYNP